MNERNMKAYHYEFDKTGFDTIDKILSAVACAGRAFHFTEDWNDEVEFGYGDHEGTSPVEWIQNAANEAAGVWNRCSVNTDKSSDPDKMAKMIAAARNDALHEAAECVAMEWANDAMPCDGVGEHLRQFIIALIKE